MLRKIGKIKGKGLGLRVADDEEENYRFYYIWWSEVNQCDYCPLRGQLGKCYHFPRNSRGPSSLCDDTIP